MNENYSLVIGNEGNRPNKLAAILIGKTGAGIFHLFFPEAADIRSINSIQVYGLGPPSS